MEAINAHAHNSSGQAYILNPRRGTLLSLILTLLYFLSFGAPTAWGQDADGDGIPDTVDAYPTVAAFGSGTVAEVASVLGEIISTTDLSHFNAPTDKANNARRNNLATRCNQAAEAMMTGDFPAALAHLWSLYDKIDGEGAVPDWMTVAAGERSDGHGNVPDWMYVSADSQELAENVGTLILILLGYDPCTIERQVLCDASGLESCDPGGIDCGLPLEPCTAEVEQACLLAGLSACTVGVNSAECGAAPLGPCDDAAQLACALSQSYPCTVGGSAACGSPPNRLYACYNTWVIETYCAGGKTCRVSSTPDGEGGWTREVTCEYYDPCTPFRQEQCMNMGLEPCEPGSYACVW